jgi:hypothetical protein
MNKDDEIEKQIQALRDQNTSIRIFDPNAYNLRESFEVVFSLLKTEFKEPVGAEDREQIIYEAFSRICSAENKDMNYIESLADLLYAKHRLEIHLDCSFTLRRKPWWRRRPYRT